MSLASGWILGARPDSIVIPERAIVELQGKTLFWVVGPDDKVTQMRGPNRTRWRGGGWILEGSSLGIASW